jgi:hypothetical protein
VSLLEGSIAHRVMAMTPELRSARANELLEMGRAYLPLLARHRAEQAKLIEHEPGASEDGEVHAQGAASDPASDREQPES